MCVITLTLRSTKNNLLRRCFPRQGYFHGEDWGQRVATPFCLVPSGSGNALAANCGLWAPETAAIAVCKGRTRALDIFSVVQPPCARYFAFLSIYYGMMANLDHGTDHLRCPPPPHHRYHALMVGGRLAVCRLQKGLRLSAAIALERHVVAHCTQ